MTIVIPRARRSCIQCGASNPEYSQLEQKNWTRADLCPACFQASKPEIYWKRSVKEKTFTDFSSFVELLRENVESCEPVDQCTGLLLAEFLIRAKLLKRHPKAAGRFRLRDSSEEFEFKQTDFLREIRVEAQKKINEYMSHARVN